MQRLHARDHAELAEARNVDRLDRFDVLDARAAILRAVHFFGVFVSIERRAHAVVADCVREKLQAALVEFGDGSLIFVGIPEKLPFQRRIVGVRLEHRRGVRLDHAIDHHFHRAAADPVVSIFLARGFDFVDVGRSQFRRIEKIRDVEAKRLLFLAP